MRTEWTPEQISPVEPTYRERREAKAERLREWSAKREAKSAAAYEQSSALAEAIPFGQPILAGHHSQRTDERRRERIYGAMSRSVEDRRKAERMAEKADNIDRAAERAIYSDDPDAIEKLREKIAGLEAKRENAKQKNAAYWREHKAEKKALSAYQRDKVQPFPAYYGRNLSGLIGTSRKRLQQLEKSSEVASA